jgi:hypothetical protein
LLRGVVGLLAGFSLIRSAAAVEILVYDHNTVHHFAAAAATSFDPTPTIGNSATFNGLLASQSWDAVLIDCPSTAPLGGWVPTIDFVKNGGRVAMSFWDWDNDSAAGSPLLPPAFGIAGTTTFSLTGRTLTDAGTSAVFAGVSMPNSDWHDHWSDDGDGFGFLLGSGTVGLANLSGIANPVMARGNGGRTIAAFLVDEAGNTWLNNGSAVNLWENMYLNLVPEPASVTLLVLGVVAMLGPTTRRRTRS